MNKLIAGGLMMAWIFTGCTQSNAAPAEPVAVEKGKVAVVCFSWSPDGNTRFAAETIAAKAGAKLFETEAPPERSRGLPRENARASEQAQRGELNQAVRSS